ncbi:904_t:CDS:2 [Entrophospora sp. SA101]|nr:904_t:CDS:2 [Entrophospora sp. SA101]
MPKWVKGRRKGQELFKKKQASVIIKNNSEKILDLKKYFVFNLGKEVKTCQQAETKSENVHSISTSLSSDQSKRIQTNNWNM